MTTKLYFHNATNAQIGTFPTTEQSVTTANWTATGATTLKTMDLNLGTTQSLMSGTTLAQTTAQSGFLGFFVSPPLAFNQIVGGGTMILGVAELESNLNANFWVNTLNMYVWRPSTGTKVGTVRDSTGTSLGGLEPTAANTEQTTYITGITSSAVSALVNDVIICEVWAYQATQASGKAYTATFYYDGTTAITAENTATSSAASFIQLSETLIFGSNGEFLMFFA